MLALSSTGLSGTLYTRVPLPPPNATVNDRVERSIRCRLSAHEASQRSLRSSQSAGLRQSAVWPVDSGRSICSLR